MWYQGLGDRDEKPIEWPMPLYLRYMYEGQTKESDPNGFGRLLYGFRASWSFTGYFHRGWGSGDFHSFTTMNGKGFLIKNFSLWYSGYYEDGLDFLAY